MAQAGKPNILVTLWAEKPMPIQLDFTLRRLAQVARRRPVAPRQAAVEGLLRAGHRMARPGDDQALPGRRQRPRSAHGGHTRRPSPTSTVEQYSDDVTEFFRTATHPKLDRPYKACGYRPMVDLLRFLEGNDFVVYIASGGDRDFMRPVANELYGIPPERVVGSSLALEYRESDQGRDVLYKGEMDFFDDGPTKPVRIWSRIGRRPVLAGGNSNGDVPMLRFARSDHRPSLRLLLLHDDAEREFDYTAGAEDALANAEAAAWTVISMKHDWSTVFGS